MSNCTSDERGFVIAGFARSSSINLLNEIISLISLFLPQFCKWIINKNNILQILSNNDIEVNSNTFSINNHKFELILKKQNGNHFAKLCINLKKYPYEQYNITIYLKLYCKQINFTSKKCYKFTKRRKSFKILNNNTIIDEKYNSLIFECYIEALLINTIYEPTGGFKFNDHTIQFLKDTDEDLLNSAPKWYNSDLNNNTVIKYEWNLNNDIIDKLKIENNVEYFSNNFGDDCFCLYLIKQKNKRNGIKLGLRLLKLPLSVYCIGKFQCLFKIPKKFKKSQPTTKKISGKRLFNGCHDINWKQMCVISDILYWLRSSHTISIDISINIHDVRYISIH
eukprot:502179_1